MLPALAASTDALQLLVLVLLLTFSSDVLINSFPFTRVIPKPEDVSDAVLF